MCTPAPFKSKEYQYARQYSSVMAELFKPQARALTELWTGEDKVVEMEYWYNNIKETGINIQEVINYDNGRGIITKDAIEPLYTGQYLPRKFKVAVTVPGDNSLDIYTNDIGYRLLTIVLLSINCGLCIGLVVITDEVGELKGFNIMVGGGMGRTHNKETTFARVADHLGFVAKDDVLELCKSILATQRDHGNREVRPNARMKYLVHEKGIDEFRNLVEVS